MGAKVKSTIDPWFINLALTPPELRAGTGVGFPSSLADVLVVEGGVIPSANDTGLSITSTGTTSAPRVTVAAGKCVVGGTGHYGWECTLPAATQVALSAPPSTNPRVDLVVARVYGGSETGEADSGFYIETIDGTPASSQQPQQVPVRSIALWEVRVSTGGVVTFTDRRLYTRSVGGVRRSVRDTATAGRHPVDLRISEAGQLEVWLGGTWQTLATPAVWSQFAPTLYYSGGQGVGGGTGSSGVYNIGGGSSAICRYIVVGKTCHLRYAFRGGAVGQNGGSGAIYTNLPPGLTSAPQEETQIIAKLNVLNLPADVYWGPCFVPQNNNILYPFFPRSINNNQLAPYHVATSQGAAGTGIPFIAGSYPSLGILIIQGSVEIT